MRSATFLALALTTLGLAPIACTQDFNRFQSSAGNGGSQSTTSSSSGSITTSSSTSTTSSSSSSSSGATGCMTDADCDDGNVCTTDACTTATGMCTHTPIDGAEPGYVDMTPDCKTQKCVMGAAMTVADDNDVPTSGNPCVTDSCMNGNVVMSDVNAGTSCGGTQKCDGAGNCVGCTMDSDCASPGACKTVTCDQGTHSCKVADSSKGTPCNSNGGKVCDGGGNCVQCVTGSDCSSGNCQNDMCAPAANGHPCTGGNQCASTHCVAGICCDHSCTGTCQACTAQLTGGTNGTCGNIMAGTPAPNNECPVSACGNDGNCNGNGGCEQFMSGTVCAPAGCTGNVWHSAETCSNMTCGGATMQDCMTYKCGDAGCPTSCGGDGDCASGNYCQNPGSTGTCVPQLATGTMCTAADQCQSGWCYGSPMQCQKDSCMDMMVDGTETDTDCGGGTCPKCISGQKCLVNSDCTSNHCFTNTKTCQ